MFINKVLALAVFSLALWGVGGCKKSQKRIDARTHDTRNSDVDVEENAAVSNDPCAPANIEAGKSATHTVTRQILQTYCAGCHAESANPLGGFSWNVAPDSDANRRILRMAIDSINGRTSMKMPPASSLQPTDSDRLILDYWAQFGFPATVSELPTDLCKSTTPVEPTTSMSGEESLGYGVDVARLMGADVAQMYRLGFDAPLATSASNTNFIDWFLAKPQDIYASRYIESRVDFVGRWGSQFMPLTMREESRLSTGQTVMLQHIFATKMGRDFSSTILNFCIDEDCTLRANSVNSNAHARFSDAVDALYLTYYGRRARADEITLVREVFPKLNNSWKYVVSALFMTAEAWHVHYK